MSSVNPCGTGCCDETVVVNTPGSAGVNAYTTTSANFTIPAIGATVNISLLDNSWMAVGQKLFISDGTDVGTFEVQSFTGTTQITAEFMGYTDDASPGAVIGSGAKVSVAGVQSPFTTTALQALNATLLTGIATFTDNTGATTSDTIAAGVGIQTWAFYVSLPDITAADIIGAFTPGYAFKVLSTTLIIEKAVTTGGKAATLTPKINGSAITGGVLGPSGTYAAGSVIAGSAVTANNTGTSAQTFSITASGVTTFSEGNGIIIVKVQNTDTVNAVASLADKINDIMNALT